MLGFEMVTRSLALLVFTAMFLNVRYDPLFLFDSEFRGFLLVAFAL